MSLTLCVDSKRKRKSNSKRLSLVTHELDPTQAVSNPTPGDFWVEIFGVGFLPTPGIKSLVWDPTPRTLDVQCGMGNAVVIWKLKNIPYLKVKPVTHNLVRRISFWWIKISDLLFEIFVPKDSWNNFLKSIYLKGTYIILWVVRLQVEVQKCRVKQGLQVLVSQTHTNARRTKFFWKHHSCHDDHAQQLTRWTKRAPSISWC